MLHQLGENFDCMKTTVFISSLFSRYINFSKFIAETPMTEGHKTQPPRSGIECKKFDNLKIKMHSWKNKAQESCRTSRASSLDNCFDHHPKLNLKVQNKLSFFKSSQTNFPKLEIAHLDMQMFWVCDFVAATRGIQPQPQCCWVVCHSKRHQSRWNEKRPISS